MGPAEVLSFLNAGLIARYQVSNYIAVTFLSLDAASGRVRLANGGMPFPYLVRDGAVSLLEIPGVPLGLFEDEGYSEIELCLLPGDSLILISDGLFDAHSPEGEIYGYDRVTESLRLNYRGKIAQCVGALYRGAADFIRNAEAHDDITIVGLHRLT